MCILYIIPILVLYSTIMKLDVTMQHIVDTVAREVADTFDVDMTDAEILAVANHQFDSVIKYAKNKETIRFQYLGKFHIKPERQDCITKAKLGNIQKLMPNIVLLFGYMYIISNDVEVDYHGIVSFIDSEVKLGINIVDIINKISVIIDDRNTPLKHMTIV